ncbi:ureidoglycolate lyase [bacterium]|nr:ureidoglycolate lyase [bacterium]
MAVKPKKLSQESFSRYGKAVTRPQGPPASHDATYQFWPMLASYCVSGEEEIGICKVFRQSSPVVTCVERHLTTPEILIPIDAPFILPLLPDGSPDKEMEAFLVDIGEAVVIDPGVWHAAGIPAGRPESFYFVLFRSHTPQEDVEKKTLSPVLIRTEGTGL